MYRLQEKVTFYRIGAAEELSSVTKTCMVGSSLFNRQWSGNNNFKEATPETQKHKINQKKKKKNNTLFKNSI